MTIQLPVATTSDLQSADAQITVMPGLLHGVALLGDGTNACNVKVYDSENNTTSGKKLLATVSLPASSITDETLIFNFGVVVNRGIYCDVSGTGASYYVYYTLGG